MPLIVIAFLAGVLTALAPCVLPIIPVVIGGSVSKTQRLRPYIVVGSLFVSIVLFTLLLKGSTILIGIPDYVWRYVSGLFIVVFGLTLVWPELWSKVTAPLRLYSKSQEVLGGAYRNEGPLGPILLGAALGPVFSSCSPVYLFILSVILPTDFVAGIVYIMAYALGLCTVLLAVGILGQKFLAKFAWATNPEGWFKRSLGVILVLAGILIITGSDRLIQNYVIENNILDITRIEQQLLQ